MQQLLGKSIQDDAIAQFLTAQSPQWQVMRETKQFADGAIYWSFITLGIQLCFVKPSKTSTTQVLDSIFLYNSQQQKAKPASSSSAQAQTQVFQQFNENNANNSCKIPQGITLQMNNVDIVKKLGEPQKKGGGARTGTNIWISYETLGLQFDLVGNSWDDLKNPISFITIFPPSSS